MTLFRFGAAMLMLTNVLFAGSSSKAQESGAFSFLPCKNGAEFCNPNERLVPYHEGFDWKWVTTDRAVIYLQNQTFEKINGLVKFRTLTDYKYSKSEHHYVVTYKAINCLTNKVTGLQQEQHHRDCTSDVLGAQGTWIFIYPGSGDEKMKQVVCK